MTAAVAALGALGPLAGCTTQSQPTSTCMAVTVVLDAGLPDAANGSAPEGPGFLPADECAAVCEGGVMECALVDAGSGPVEVQCFPQCI